MNHDEFRRLLRQQGEELYRDMPWRQDTRPYYVLVSELMLQQTQVDRVIPKFEAFITRFPDEAALAAAPLAEVVKQWQGLGYNRRARFLHEAAKRVVERGGFPETAEELVSLPGIGKNTAGAIMAYAYNKPAIFIETNVRAVYIHHFFGDDPVDDKDILPLLQATIDTDRAREFYWALMDYGSLLKRQGVRPERSRHYKKQAPLSGSLREMRGIVVKFLSERDDMPYEELRQAMADDERLRPAVDGLVRDGLVVESGGRVRLTN